MKLQENRGYDNIIHLPHHISKRHPQMPLLNRAAQFSPFAALTGHEDAILEAARQTDSFIELNEDRKEQLDEQLQLLKENLDQKPVCEITYFQPDEKKNGGAYVTICKPVKKIDEYQRRTIFTDGTALPIEHIFSMEGELFRTMDML